MGVERRTEQFKRSNRLYGNNVLGLYKFKSSENVKGAKLIIAVKTSRHEYNKEEETIYVRTNGQSAIKEKYANGIQKGKGK